jgi:NADPH:quinone reductase-like Zn-dependent oxidoreductase
MAESRGKLGSGRRWVRRLKRLAWWSAVAIAVVVSLAFAALVVGYYRSDNECGDPNRPVLVHPVKAIRYCDYGPPDVLRYEDIEKPTPDDEQILVRIHAASINPYDWHMIRGTPRVMRLGTGLRRPKETRLGIDFAGTVEAVGKSVTKFQPGDEVFGKRVGALAEYVVVREDGAVTRKPANVTFEQAASVGIAATTALQALRDRGKIHPGQKILINGASGGVGTYAVQIAKHYGADVTGVCSTRNVDRVRSLGADRVIDYTKEDFAKDPARYDVLLDNVGNRPLSECRSVLTPNGQYILIGGGGPDDGLWIGPLARAFRTMAMSWFVEQDMGLFMASASKDDLVILGDLIQSGAITPVIDRRYPLSDTAEAVRYLEEGHARGKVILTVE